MGHLAHSLVLLVAATINLANAAPSPSTTEACSKILEALPNGLSMPGEPAYNKENRDWYNMGLADLKPACIAFPKSTEDVSSIVKLLNTYPDTPFAVKSGGHSPNPGHSSVKDGVLIALREIKGTTLDKEKGLAYVKPGGHWWDVINALDGTGHSVVGGRLGVVGIGGYLMQGGVSFLSGQYGLGADVSSQQRPRVKLTLSRTLKLTKLCLQMEVLPTFAKRLTLNS
jgi:FAD/FMN-containing dehydrogenase